MVLIVLNDLFYKNIDFSDSPSWYRKIFVEIEKLISCITYVLDDVQVNEFVFPRCSGKSTFLLKTFLHLEYNDEMNLQYDNIFLVSNSEQMNRMNWNKMTDMIEFYDKNRIPTFGDVNIAQSISKRQFITFDVFKKIILNYNFGSGYTNRNVFLMDEIKSPQIIDFLEKSDRYGSWPLRQNMCITLYTP